MSGVAQYLECETSGCTSSELRVTIYSYYSLEKWSIVLNPSGNTGWVQLSNTVGYASKAYSVTGSDYLHGTYNGGQIWSALVAKYGNAAFSARVSGALRVASTDNACSFIVWVDYTTIRIYLFNLTGQTIATIDIIQSSNTLFVLSICF
jgi:hypothetical protein